MSWLVLRHEEAFGIIDVKRVWMCAFENELWELPDPSAECGPHKWWQGVHFAWTQPLSRLWKGKFCCGSRTIAARFRSGFFFFFASVTVWARPQRVLVSSKCSACHDSQKPVRFREEDIWAYCLHLWGRLVPLRRPLHLCPPAGSLGSVCLWMWELESCCMWITDLRICTGVWRALIF